MLIISPEPRLCSFVAAQFDPRLFVANALIVFGVVTSLCELLRIIICSVFECPIILCLPPPPPPLPSPKVCINYCCQMLCSREYAVSPRAFENNTLCKIWGANKVYFGALEIENLCICCSCFKRLLCFL